MIFWSLKPTLRTFLGPDGAARDVHVVRLRVPGVARFELRCPEHAPDLAEIHVLALSALLEPFVTPQELRSTLSSDSRVQRSES